MTAWAGTYAAYGGTVRLTIEAAGGAHPASLDASPAGDSSGLVATLGPYARTPLGFSKLSSTLPLASASTNASCMDVAIVVMPMVASWATHALDNIARLPGSCFMAEFTVAAEAPAAGVSAANKTVAFPWGCGAIPLPDGPTLVVISHGPPGAERGVFASFMGEGLPVEAAA